MGLKTDRHLLAVLLLHTLQEDRADLDRYLAYIARTPASAFAAPQELLAHYINSYNALSMYNSSFCESSSSAAIRCHFMLMRTTSSYQLLIPERLLLPLALSIALLRVYHRS